MINPKIFKAYDIRGIYPDELNEENIVPIIKAIYRFFSETIQKNGPLSIVLGRDMRLSSPSLFEVAKKVLIEAGAQVIDVGLVSTPSFYFALFHYAYDAGIQITASHNPKEYNGIKIAKYSPEGLIKIGGSTGMDTIKQYAQQDIVFSPSAPGSVVTKTDTLDEEVLDVLQMFGNPQLKSFTVAADPGNAMGITYIEALFKKIPGNLIRMNFELDGSFPVHQPDPLDPKNLVDLQKKVVDEHADLGIAPDGDGDRLFFIDEKGAVVPPTLITSLVAQELLKQTPGAKILFDIRYILTPQKVVAEAGGTSDVTRVGHAFITEAMSKTGAIFAGESSAHYYYKANGNAESQLITLVCVLKALSEANMPFSQLLGSLQRSFESGEYNFEVHNAEEIMSALKEKYADGQLNTIDGIAIAYPEWRFNVRVSNTEPLMRLNVEAIDKTVMEEKRDELMVLIEAMKK